MAGNLGTATPRSPWRRHPESTIYDVRGGRQVYEWLDAWHDQWPQGQCPGGTAKGGASETVINPEHRHARVDTHVCMYYMHVCVYRRGCVYNLHSMCNINDLMFIYIIYTFTLSVYLMGSSSFMKWQLIRVCWFVGCEHVF